MLLTVLIRLYRVIPWRPSCPRTGPSCSELGLAIARSGGTVGDVLRLIASCQGDGAPGPECEDLGTGCCGTGCHTTSVWLRRFS